MSIEELYKILLSDKPSDILLNNENDLFKLIPELKMCKGFNQNSKWHIYDVYEHILHVVDYVPKNITLRLAALFHDLGKPYTYTEDENKEGHFYGHWEISKKIFNEFSNKYNIDKDIGNLVSNLIYYHDINIAKFDDEKIKELYQLLEEDGIKKLYELKKADLLAQNENYHYILDDYEKQQERINSIIKRE